MENKIIKQEHFHIDNGGFTFQVDEYGNTTISFGFFGYSSTSVTLTSGPGFGPKQLSQFFKEASEELSKISTETDSTLVS